LYIITETANYNIITERANYTDKVVSAKYKKKTIVRKETTVAVVGFMRIFYPGRTEIFVEEGKPENRKKKSSEQDENQQQTRPIYGTSGRI